MRFLFFAVLIFFVQTFIVLGQECPVLINEIITKNEAVIEDGDGIYSEFVELFNTRSTSFNLENYYLTDDSTDKKKWRFPSFTIEPNGYQICWISGKDKLDTSVGIHVNFCLNTGGGSIFLVDPDGITIVDRIICNFLPDDVSFGRYPDGYGSLFYFDQPTPFLGNSALVNIKLGSWKQLTPHASFKERDGAGGLVFKNKMWILGGYAVDFFPPSIFIYPLNDIWNSTNGETWEYAGLLDSPPRHCSGWTVFDDKMWRIAGDNLTDVYNSPDGDTWNLINPDAPFGARYTPFVYTFRDRIWVAGGLNTDINTALAKPAFNDVWSSSDGVNWIKETESAEWSPRGLVHGTIVFKDKLWILGGGIKDYYNAGIKEEYFNDIWNSEDGIHWKKVINHTPWEARSHFSVAVYDDKIWVTDGSVGKQENLSNETWYSSDGLNWFMLESEEKFPPRHASCLLAYDGSLFITAGFLFNDVWKFTSPTIFYSKPAGDLSDLSTWGSSLDGSGIQPDSFVRENQYFVIRNRDSVTLESDLLINGNNSKLIVGDNLIRCHLIIPENFAYYGIIDVSAHSTLSLKNQILPSLGELDKESTIIYGQSSGPTEIVASDYGTLILNGSEKIFRDGVKILEDLILDTDRKIDLNRKSIQIGGDMIIKTEPDSLLTNESTVSFDGPDIQKILSQKSDSVCFYNMVVAKSGGELILCCHALIKSTFYKVSGELGSINNYRYTYAGNSWLCYQNDSSSVVTNDLEFPEISGPANVRFRCADGIKLHDSRNITGTVELDCKLFLNGNSLTYGDVINYNSANYFVTDNMGFIRAYLTGNEKTIPIGTDTSYNPVRIENKGDSDFYHISVFPDVTVTGEYGASTIDSIEHTIRTSWNIKRETTGGSDLDVIVQWNRQNEGKRFNLTSACGSFNSGSGWIYYYLATDSCSSDPSVAVIKNISEDGAVTVGDNFSGFYKCAQSIVFGPQIKSYSDEDFSPATSSSGLPAYYSSSDSSIVSIIENKLHIIDTGKVFIKAFQPGNDFCLMSDTVTQLVAVLQSTLTVETMDYNKFYGEDNPLFDLTYSGFKQGEDESVLDLQPHIVTETSKTSEVGEYFLKIEGGFDNHYLFKTENTHFIKVLKTRLQFIADNQKRDFGSPNPDLTYSIYGLVNSDSLQCIDVMPELKTTADLTSLSGTYPIFFIGGLDNNYDFIFVEGVLEVELVYPVVDILLEANAPNTVTVKGEVISSGGGNLLNGIVYLGLSPEINSAPILEKELDPMTSNNEFEVKFDNLEVNTLYYVACSIANDKFSTRSDILSYVFKTNEKWELQGSLKTYPNPVNDYFSVDLLSSNNTKIIVSLFSLNGKKIYGITYNEDIYPKNIDISNLSSGIYLVEIKGFSIHKIIRIIKL